MQKRSEFELRTEFEEAAAHRLVRGQPLYAVAGVLRENGAPVEDVVNVEIASERESLNLKTLDKAKVHLLKPILEARVRCNQFNIDIGVARGRAAARSDITAELAGDLCVGADTAELSRTPGVGCSPAQRTGNRIRRLIVDTKQGLGYFLYKLAHTSCVSVLNSWARPA